MEKLFPASSWLCWIVGMLLLIGVPAAYFTTGEDGRQRYRRQAKWGFSAGAALLLLGLLFSAIVIVPAGRRGMPVRFGAPQDRVLSNGFGWRIPGAEKVMIYDTRVQKVSFENLDTASSEYQDVAMTGVLNYRINPEAIPWLVRNVGGLKDLEDKVLIPALRNNLKYLVPREYEISAVLGNRNRIGQQATAAMDRTFEQYRTDDGTRVVFFTAETDEEKIPKVCYLEAYTPPVEITIKEVEQIGGEVSGSETPQAEPTSAPTPTLMYEPPIEVEAKGDRCIQSVFLENIDFGEDFNYAIEQKQVALQEAERELYVLSRKRIEAQQAIAIAEGERGATIARAEGVANANRQIADSLSGPLGTKVITFLWVDKLASTMRTMILPASGTILDISKAIGEVPEESAQP